jgi:hypothetical protein
VLIGRIFLLGSHSQVEAFEPATGTAGKIDKCFQTEKHFIADQVFKPVDLRLSILGNHVADIDEKPGETPITPEDRFSQLQTRIGQDQLTPGFVGNQPPVYKRGDILGDARPLYPECFCHRTRSNWTRQRQMIDGLHIILLGRCGYYIVHDVSQSA